MTEQESSISLHDFIDEETRHIDVVASWENLNDTYDTLRFTDQLSDAERLEEYKWIIQQMNSFLTKVRTKLLTCRDTQAMTDLLASMMVPSGKVELSARRSLVYQKLRQQWIRSMTMRIHVMTQEMEE